MKTIEVVIEESVTHVTTIQVDDDFGMENTDVQDEFILANAEITPLDWDGNSHFEVITWREI